MKTRRGRKAALAAIVLAILLSLAGCLGHFRTGSTFFGPCADNCQNNEFLYATSPGHISAFIINQSTGALSAPLAVSGPNQSIGMVGSVTLGHLFVSDFVGDAVEGFSIDSNSGGLTPVGGSPFPIGGTPPGAGGLSNIPSGDFYLYATDLNGGTVAGFRFDPVTGILTPVSGSPFLAGNTPMQATQDSLSKFLYVSNYNDSQGGISAFEIDQSTGSLSPIPGSPFATGIVGSYPGPSAMVVNNNFLYVALAGTANPNNKIVAFSIDQTSGVLTTLPTSPFVTGSDPLYIAFVPVTSVAGQAFLYTANNQDGTISAFTADDNTGALTPINGSPYAAGTSVGGLATTPIYASTGNPFLYASNPQSQTITGYTIDGSTGALSPVPGSPFPAGNSPALLAVVIP